ncbi:MAG TPA: glycoside hydrolase family 2 protein, partial [Puia sp.]
KNTGRIPAFMVELDITGVKRAFYASDDYLWLAPGESKEISLNVLWREKQQNAHLSVGAWNAAPVQTLLK